MNIRAEVIWFLAWLALMLVEFASPRMVLVFFGLGAWIAALATFFGLTQSPLWQTVLFAATSFAMLWGLRGLVRKRFAEEENRIDTREPE